jgi:phage nucleotide-binding protein
VNKPRSWVIYGRAGSGKTTLGGSFPGPILLLDCKDEGTDSVSDIKDIDVMEIREWEDIEHAYWWLVQNPKRYKTLIVDTITQLQQVVVEEIGSKKAEKAGKNCRRLGHDNERRMGRHSRAPKDLDYELP